MSIETAQLEQLFAATHIGPDTSRSSAKRTKRAQQRFNCAQCLKQFNDFGKFSKHLRDRGHIYDRVELKADHKEAQAELLEARSTGDESDIKTAEFNKQLAMLRLTALEQLSRRR